MIEPIGELVSPERLALANQFLKVLVFVLGGFVGFLVITRVPPLLHTPLMSATNAISAISIVGAIVVAGGGHGTFATVLGVIAVSSAATNVVAGFVSTDIMLRFFKSDREQH